MLRPTLGLMFGNKLVVLSEVETPGITTVLEDGCDRSTCSYRKGAVKVNIFNTARKSF